ncbi:MAG: RHS repeat-associated core domain-containing protein [Nitrososphaerales archaeon]
MYYFHEDALGSTRLVTSGSSSTLFGSNYIPFGSSYGQSGSFLTSFRYKGKFDDYNSTGLYYFGARFYDPSINRFITEDSTKGSLEDPLSLNRYIYARDNPEAIVDPTGHDWWSSLTSAVSNVASDVSSDLTGAATDVSNAWNGLSPTDQALVVAVVVTAVVVTATVLTAGAAAPVAADAIATEAGDVAATEAATALAAEGATEGSSALGTIGWNIVGGAIGGGGSNTVSDLAAGRQITAQDVAEGALVGALGGALTGGAGVAFPFKASIGRFLLAQAGAGIVTELSSVDVNTAVNHRPLPPLWEAVGFGAAAGIGGGLIGEAYGPGASGIVLGGFTTGIFTGFISGYFSRFGTYLRTSRMGPILP